MVKEDILKAFSSFSKFMDAATIPGYYRDTNRSSLLQSGTATRSNTAWKKCEYIIAYLDDETSIHPLEDYIEGWRKITKNYDGQILFLEESKDVWGMYNSKGDHIGDTSKITSFLSKMTPKSSKRILSVDFNWSLFSEACLKSGLIFSDQMIQRFIASLCTKPFVICSGLSGSGKTKLAQAFAQWICYKEEDGEKNEQYCIVPVGADWTNREPLLGYPNALNKEEYVSPENGVLDLMVRAKKNIENTEEPTKPYFLILDEMNLSHVERYFADFLSTMESGDTIPLHKILPEPTKDLITIPQTLKLPKNLFIIGTVNIDETTYMFSPKVLDRANTIEFRLTEKDLAAFIESDIILDMELLKAQGANMSDGFMAMALQETDKNLKKSEGDLKLFFSELKKSGAEFGFRTANEIGRLMFMLNQLGETDENSLDIAIMQKLLPKLHGSRSKLNTTLTTLAKFCVQNAIIDFKDKDEDFRKIYFIPFDKLPKDLLDNIKFKISFEKISRMHTNAIENGFTSYAEA